MECMHEAIPFFVGDGPCAGEVDCLVGDGVVAVFCFFIMQKEAAGPVPVLVKGVGCVCLYAHT